MLPQRNAIVSVCEVDVCTIFQILSRISLEVLSTLSTLSF